MAPTNQTNQALNSTKAQTIKKSDHNSHQTKTRIPKPKRLSGQTIAFCIFVVAWSVIATIAAQYFVALPMTMILRESIMEPGWMLLYYILSYAITLFLVLVIPPKVLQIYRAQKKDSTKNLDNLEKDLKVTKKGMGLAKLPTFVDIGLAPVGYAIYLVLASVLTTLMSMFIWFNAEEAQNVGFQGYLTGMDQIYAMISVVFVAPIAEELVMRGWLYGKLRRKLSYPVAMLIVSLAFAVLHGQWNVGVTVFALSIVLCTLREITGTIWSGILLHILSNGIAFYYLYIIM